MRTTRARSACWQDAHAAPPPVDSQGCSDRRVGGSRGGALTDASVHTNARCFRGRRAVEVVCREGPARVLELVQLGAQFTTQPDGALHLTKEGGHSARRVVHAADMTGREIERALLAAARAHRNIR